MVLILYLLAFGTIFPRGITSCSTELFRKVAVVGEPTTGGNFYHGEILVCKEAHCSQDTPPQKVFLRRSVEELLKGAFTFAWRKVDCLGQCAQGEGLHIVTIQLDDHLF